MLKILPMGDKRDISVNVTDGTNPIKGASVSIGTITSTTGNAGGCTLKDVTDGSNSITVTAIGYTDKTSTITVSEDNTSFTITLTPVIYDFTSYGDSSKSEELATGTAQQTGVDGDYLKIKVLTNSVDGFVGNEYYVTNEAEADGTTAYQLYTDAGSTGTGMYVTISLHE